MTAQGGKYNGSQHICKYSLAAYIFADLLIAACPGKGGGDGSVSKGTPRCAFVANYNDNSVSSYAVDAGSGRLTYIGKVATGTGPDSVAVDPALNTPMWRALSAMLSRSTP